MLYENGEFERIRPHLTPLECGIIFDGIPEGAISRKVGLIWGIPVKGSHRLDGQQKAILRRLFMLRESEARRRSQPPYYVLPHETLVHLASNPTADPTQLPSLRRQVDTPFGRLLRTTLRQGLADPPISSPKSYKVQPSTPGEVERLQRLKKWRIYQGRQLSIDASLVWPMASLERVAKAPHMLDA